MPKVERLIELFGSGAALAREAGVDPALVVRWKRDGYVPAHHNTRVIEAAITKGLDLMEVNACLEPNVCPCCQRAMPEGQVVDRRFMLLKRTDVVTA